MALSGSRTELGAAVHICKGDTADHQEHNKKQILNDLQVNGEGRAMYNLYERSHCALRKRITSTYTTVPRKGETVGRRRKRSIYQPLANTQNTQIVFPFKTRYSISAHISLTRAYWRLHTN